MSRGFTLIELIVYVAVMSIVFGALASLVVSGNRGVLGREHIDDIYVAQAHIMKSIRSDADQATAVSVGAGSLSFTIGGAVTYTLSGGVLVRDGVALSLPSVIVSDFVAEVHNSKGVSVSMVLTHAKDSDETLYIENAFVLYE